jgi:ABC-type transport system involved in Fe-S cluster assembly fused permease/ATPase subunit
VKKVAYGEITSSVFEHLLNLSLQWHLKKKIGQVIRSMDRYGFFYMETTPA